MKKLAAIILIFILVLQMASIVYAWEVERPSNDINIKERTENASTNGEASVGIGVAIKDYNEAPNDYSADFVSLNVSMTANSRIGITYDCSWDNLWWVSEDDLWHRNDMVGVGDDVIIPIDIPQPPDIYYFAFRFYGGYGSAEYQRLYVSSNGFISFDNRSQPSPAPSDIPSTSKPNALIAAVWSDLNVDSSSSIITGFWIFSSCEYYVIIWKNVLHKASGNRLTFEIILENAPQYYPADRRYSQSRIWISYKDVSSINAEFTYGIEDQQGAKGIGGLCSGSSLEYFKGYTVEFYQSSNSYFLKRLTLTFQDTNPNTQFEIREEDNGYFLRGYNIRPNWNQPWEPDYTYKFTKALAGTATLLIDAWSLVANPPAWVVAGGFIVDTILVTLDLADILAYNQISGRSIDVFDMNDGLWQKANATALTYDYVVDASLSLVVHWILKTSNSVGTHSLTITATAEYYEYSMLTGEIIPKDPISTSVNLKIGPDDNDNPDSADEISTGWHYRLYIGGYDANDYYKIYVTRGYVIYVYATGTSSPKPVFYLDLYDPNGEWRTGTSYACSNTLSFTADSTGYWLIRVHIYDDTSGFYSLYVSLHYPYSSGGGGGGCPYVYAWNGSQYVIDNNLLPASEGSNGADVNDYYRLEQKLVPMYEEGFLSLYSLQIREFEHEHTYLDTIKLFAVDHDPNIKVGVTLDGQILTYEDPVPPISAVNSRGENVLTPLYLADNNYYQGFEGDYLILDFGEINPKNVDVKLILRTDRPPLKMSIHIQILDSSGQWKEIATIIPRTYWATDIINLSNYLPNSKTELKIRLYFTASHKIDFIGLDISKQADIKIYKAQLILAKHSSEGLITSKLLKNDNIYTELKPEEQITLLFITYKKPSLKERAFVIYVEGHYYTIKS